MDREVKALIKLLEDPDSEVFQAATEKLLDKGLEAIPGLEKAWETSLNQALQDKIEEIIHVIQFDHVKNELSNWAASEDQNLLQGAYLVAKFQFPDLYLSEIEQQIEILRKEAWLEMHDNLTALEKVRILNHVLFARHKFTRNSGNFYSPGNSFINQVLETKKGNPISLSIIYSIVAKKINLPIFGVNLPLNYILAYLDPFYEDDPNGILFYINPYNRGTVLSRKDIDRFLYEQKLEPRKEFYVPCSNAITIERMLRNLVFAYEKMEYQDKSEQVKQLLSIVKSASGS